MNKITLILSLSMLIVFKSNAQFTPVTSGTTLKLDAIHFMDAQNGYCSGSLVNTLVTTDGGSSWTTSSSQSFRDFSFYNSTYGYGISISGISMAKTINGGASWTSITPYNSNSLWGVAATSATTAYFVGTGGVLWKTINGGTTVTTLSSGTTSLITDIVFVNSTTGFFVAQNGQIKKTINSGTSWSTVVTLACTPTEMFFVDENTGYVVGSSGTVAKTIDGGSNWTTLTTNITNYLQGVKFFDANHGTVVGLGGTILYTDNAGATWTKQTSGTTTGLYDVAMTSATSAIVTGDNGTILKSTNLTTDVDRKKDIDCILYLDPVSEKLLIKSTINIQSIEIFTNTGNLVMSENSLNQTNISLDFTEKKPGVYFVYIKTNEGDITKKILK